jgi:hydroxymethylbilane synthase
MVMRALETAHPSLHCEEDIITTQGDKRLDTPLPLIGGKGLFTAELETALREKRVHAAVHSLKDLPTEMPDGLVLGAIPRRADPRDALVSEMGYTLESLPTASIVGTSSPRRAAQIRLLRNDLRIESIRGNIDTRLRKLEEGQYDAVVFALAGLHRLGLDETMTSVLRVIPLDEMLPAPGQGALAIQCRADDEETLAALAAIHDAQTANAVLAERAFLEGLGGGCAVPIAAHAEEKDGVLHLKGLIASPDGRLVLRVEGEGNDAKALGNRLAREALSQGAASILNEEPIFRP